MTDLVHVATWNCFGAPAGLYGLITASPHLPERFRSARIARALAAYDVVCIQENFLDSVAIFLEDLAELLGMNLWHDRKLPQVMAKSYFGSGLAIMTPQPLDVAFEMFPGKASGFDAYATKGFATCELKTRAGTSFRVVNLHLQADDPKYAPDVFEAARRGQIGALCAALKSFGDELPTLVCGDLNVREGSDEYHRLLAPLMRNAGFVDVAEGLGLHTYTPARNAMLARVDPGHPDVRIDYVWTRDGRDLRWKVVQPPRLFLAEALEERSAPHVFASDHFGIGVELELENKS